MANIWQEEGREGRSEIQETSPERSTRIPSNGKNALVWTLASTLQAKGLWQGNGGSDLHRKNILKNEFMDGV